MAFFNNISSLTSTCTFRTLEPDSDKFEPDSSCWAITSRDAAFVACLTYVIDELFDHSNVSDSYTKSQVEDACLKCGYFGYGNIAIAYIPQANTSSLMLMEKEE